MTTRLYSDLLDDVAALCGCDFASEEAARVKRFINRRARKAYAESDIWPRFYQVGEERIVSATGLLPYSEEGKSDIGTVLRIHNADPYKVNYAREYGDFYAEADGIQITGYVAARWSNTPNLTVSGSLNPDVTGEYEPVSSLTSGGITLHVYRSISNSTHEIYPAISSSGGVATLVTWALGVTLTNDKWGGDIFSPLSASTPDTVTEWVSNPAGEAAGTPSVSELPSYSAFVTYKAALSATYGTADGDSANVPEEWYDYMVHGAYADFLRNDQQQEKAALAEQEANEFLQQQLERVSRQGGSALNTRIINHANTQHR